MPTWGDWGGAQGLPAGLSQIKVAGSEGRGAARLTGPLKAFLSCLSLLPLLLWFLSLGPPTKSHLFIPHLFANLPPPPSPARHQRV